MRTTLALILSVLGSIVHAQDVPPPKHHVADPADASITISTARDPIRLTHGPMLGQPTATSMRVWARTSDPGQFEVHYGTAAGAMDSVSEPGETTIGHDNTGVVDLVGLSSDTRYHYQVWVNGRPHGLPGSFRTLPSADQSRNETYNPDGLFNFRFQIGSCANQNPLHGSGHRATTYEHLVRDWADKVHFHVMNGDWLYEEQRRYPPDAWQLVQGASAKPRVAQIAPTIIGVWENYKLYLDRGEALSQWHRHVPSYFTFDDHELVNDIWGSAETGKRHRRTVFRDIGTQAWYDYLGWANPTEYHHPIHFGKATMRRDSDLLYDQNADFTKMPLAEMGNLHVH
uniref:alkaline phosphatase D family protein n=1 Tax=Stieleria sp. TaxID=2795976 RepID=UPI00356961F8